MARCRKKRFERVELCAGDLRNRVTLQRRQQQAGIGISDPELIFVDQGRYFAGIETITTQGGGTKRFVGVALDPNATHMVWIRYSSTLSIPEDNNSFFLLSTNRRLRVLRVSIVNEDRQYFAIQCSERGDADQAGSST